MRLLSLAKRRGIEINNSLKWVKNFGSPIGYGDFYFLSNGLQIRRSNGLYFGAQTLDIFRSNVLRRNRYHLVKKKLVLAIIQMQTVEQQSLANSKKQIYTPFLVLNYNSERVVVV